MLMIVYYFHWVSYLLKLAFIIAFSTSADLIYDDLIEAGQPGGGICIFT